MADQEVPKLITFRAPITKEFMDDVTQIVAEMSMEHDRQMVALWNRTDRYRRQRNMLAITLGVAIVKGFLRARVEFNKKLSPED